MKRYDRSSSDFSEQTLRLQPAIPEPRSPAVHADKAPGAAERLFAIRGALLEQAAGPRVQDSYFTRH